MAKTVTLGSLVQNSLATIPKTWPYALACVFFSLITGLVSGATGDISLLCLASLLAGIGSLFAQLLYSRAVFHALDSKKFTFARLAEGIATPLWRVIGLGILTGLVLAIPTAIFVLAFVAAAYQLSESAFLVCAGAAILAAIPILYYLSALSLFSYAGIVYKDKPIAQAFADARQLLGENRRAILPVFALVSIPYAIVVFFLGLRMTQTTNPWFGVVAIAGVLLQTVWLTLYHRLAKGKK